VIGCPFVFLLGKQKEQYKNYKCIFDIPTSFACPVNRQQYRMLTKEVARKRHPTVPSACGGCLVLLAVGGTLSTINEQSE